MLKDRDTLLNLVHDIQQVMQYETDFKDIKTDLKICGDAANWLRKNREDLTQYVKKKIFAQRLPVTLRKDRVANISLKELKRRFAEDIDCYLGWIEAYLWLGATPRNFEKSKVYLDVSTDYYKQAFSIITHEKLNPDVSGLSVKAAEMLASYINRFLIDRNIDDLDT